MKRFTVLLIILITASLKAQDNLPSKWYLLETDKFDLFFTQADSADVYSYLAYFDNSYQHIEQYFGEKFLTKFEVYIHPNRSSIDLEWSANWDMPGFKSPCWMVATGVADQFDLLSPRVWNEEACDHDPDNKIEIQKLITNEMMSVFHGQINLDHFFSTMKEMAWFIEGVAIFISGQLDDGKMQDTKILVQEDRFPRDLTKFWQGDSRYGLSGSLVKFIHTKFGTEILFELLKTQTNEELLKKIDMTEELLIEQWADSFFE
jgi:hypothetical protein